MQENSQESLEPGVISLEEESSGGAARQSMLEKLAERTVLQAEALAQEITENARQEGEAEGIKVLAEYSEKANSDALQLIDLAKQRSATLIDEAMAKAHEQSEDILGKAQSEGQDILSKAQSEGKEILDGVRQEGLAIIHASQTRANSTESNATLKAEFIIKQTTQSVADGIRGAVLEVCNNLLPTMEELGKEVLADHVERAAVTKMEIQRDAGSNGTEENHSPPDPSRTDAQTSDKLSGRKAKSSARR